VKLFTANSHSLMRGHRIIAQASFHSPGIRTGALGCLPRPAGEW
jgi:hypothetical protein